jgi:hypothetical protein
MKKTALAILLTAVLMFTSTMAEALVCDLTNREVTLCDNFGKVWVLTLDKGDIRGYRESALPSVETGDCGRLAVYGTICCPQNKIRLTVLDTPSDICVATFWEGRFTTHELDTIEGLVYNERGEVEEFLLWVCDSEPTTATGEDPAE